MSTSKIIYAIALAAALTLGCAKEQAASQHPDEGEDAEQDAVEDARGFEDAERGIQDAVDNAGDEMEDASDDIEEEVSGPEVALRSGDPDRRAGR